MKYGFIYETTNLINGKKYIGSHVRSHSDPNDPDDSWYLGSGLLIDKAINRYGKENFNRKILEECDSDEILAERESYYLKEVDAANNPMYYNLINSGYLRGIQGYHHTEDSLEKMRENNYVRIHGRSEESRKKQSATLKKNNHQNLLASRAKDTSWVTNGEDNKRVKDSDIDDYLLLNKDWYRGFTSNRSKVIFTDSRRKAMSDSKKKFLSTEKGKAQNALLLEKMNPRGKIWISKEGERKLLYPGYASKYLELGWKKGMNN